MIWSVCEINAANSDDCQKETIYLACEGGNARAMEWTPASLGFLWTFVSAVRANPG